MSMMNWAEQECRLACKRENPDFDFDSDDFDYGCSCYKSALKAYKSLCEDGHSGTSWGFTKNILIKLMEGQPLTPITDEDFFIVKSGIQFESDESLKERGLKSSLQCPRMHSLFRDETLDGKVIYHDNDRAYYVNVEDPSDTFHSWTGFLDEMFPITMPYTPEKGKYKIFAQTFLTDKKNGDFDTRGILYLETPKGEKVYVDIYETERDGEWVRISGTEYNELLKKRIDKVSFRVADKILWTLISNSSQESEITRREKAYDTRDKKKKDKDIEKLRSLCRFFDHPENCKYNTFGMRQALCRGDEELYKDVPSLVKIASFLKKLLSEL